MKISFGISRLLLLVYFVFFSLYFPDFYLVIFLCMCDMIYDTKWDFRNDKLTFCFFQRVEPLNSKSLAKYAGMCQDQT